MSQISKNNLRFLKQKCMYGISQMLNKIFRDIYFNIVFFIFTMKSSIYSNKYYIFNKTKYFNQEIRYDIFLIIVRTRSNFSYIFHVYKIKIIVWKIENSSCQESSESSINISSQTIYIDCLYCEFRLRESVDVTFARRINRSLSFWEILLYSILRI